MSEWIDLTRLLDKHLLCWPGREPPDLVWDRRIEDGHNCNASSFSMSAHTGTHIDAPLHFVEGGQAIDALPLETLIGPGVLVDVRALRPQTLDVKMARNLADARRLLIRTGFGEDGSFAQHPALLTLAAAELLLAGGLCLVGTDRLSVDPSSGQAFDLHRLLLGSGCAIVEGLDLRPLVPRRYEICALPLAVTGAEAGPARVIARQV